MPSDHLNAEYFSPDIFEFITLLHRFKVRYVVVGGLLAIGIGALQLTPLPLLVAFIAGQVAWMISGLTSGIN